MRRSFLRAVVVAGVLLAGCGREPIVTEAGLGAPCLRNADCASPFICLDAKCVPTPIGCQPGERRCNGAAVEQCDEAGQKFETLEQCSAGCQADACVAPVCTAGTTRCEANSLTACLPNGSGYAFVQFCIDGCREGACSPPQQECAPLANRCNGKALESCRPDGLGWAFVQFCAIDCAEGACTEPEVVCTPRESRCNGKAIETCTPDGYGYAFVQYCTTDCVDGACTPEPTSCTPRESRCNGKAIETCTPDGRGFAFVQFCSTDCVDGACAAAACRPFATRCADPSSVETCSADGLAYVAEACGEGRVCESGACVPSICVPEARRCAGNRVETCNALGTAWLSAGNCAHGCLEGQCLEATCVAGSRRCNDKTVEQCLPDGTGHLFVNTCPTSCLDGACTTAVCRPSETRCGDATTLQTCSGDGTAWVDTACGEGSACDRSQCRPTLCAPAETRCVGRFVESCNTLGTGWEASLTCQYGCADGACAEPACEPAARRCTGTAVEQCLPDRTGYAFVEFCTGPCVDGACTPPLCVPLDRRCNGLGVQVCNGTGSAWVTVETCDDACTDGFCTSEIQQCAPGERRCNGRDVQACGSDARTWTTTETCVGTCSGGACAGGGCRAFTLATTPASLPADGVSTALVTSGTITDPAGVAVPDGTLFTVSVTGGTFASADADAVGLGHQVRSLGGRIKFTVRAPAAAGSVQVAAAYRDSTACAGTATLAATTPAGRMVFAEDFSDVVRRDPVATTATWDVSKQRVDALPYDANLGVNTGTGRDGDLVVAPTQTYNLQASVRPGFTAPDVAVHRVSFIDTRYGNDFVLVDPPAHATLSPGDEVMLVNAQGGACGGGNTCDASIPNWSSRVGTYEFLTVRLARPDGLVFFTSQVRNTYSDGGNADLRGQKIFIQRVPNYDRVTVDGTLTSEAWDPDARKTGMIVFRSRRGITINGPAGKIDASGLGYRGGRADKPLLTSRNLYDNSAIDLIGQAGESYVGTPHYHRDAWSGGGGGGFAGFCGWWSQSDTKSIHGGGGGYATAGHKLGLVDDTWPEGDVGRGSTYGDASLSRLYLGAGGGANGTVTVPCFYNQRIGSCDYMTHYAGTQCGTNTYCYSDNQGSSCDRRRCNARSCQLQFVVENGRPGGRGGGLIALFTHSLTVGGAGILSNGTKPVATDNGGAGGSILIHANSATLGSGLVQALGAYTLAFAVTPGQRPPGDGRIAINYFDFALTGATNPPAYTNLLGVFRKNMVQSFAVDAVDAPRSVTAIRLASLQSRVEGGDVSFFVSADGGRTWTAAAAIGTDTPIPAPARGTDVRWRAEFRPLSANPLAVEGVVLDFAVATP